MGRKIIDLKGKKFGRLLVIRRSYPNSKYGHANFLCKCDCGIEKIIGGNGLRRGSINSCGCFRREFMSKISGKLSLGVGAMRALICSYKKRAERKGYKYKLTEKQFAEITQRDCYYCGARPSGVSRPKKYNGKYIYNGIDRIDNNKGYITGNVVPCCKICNSAKNTLTLKEYKKWIKKSYEKIFKDKYDKYFEEE